MPRELSAAVQAILAEAAGEGPDGMARVAKVIRSRTLLPRWRGMSMDDVARQPKQFSGMQRTDLKAFLAKQPPSVIADAQRAHDTVMADTKMKPWADHYVTADLYKKSSRPSWVGKMKVIERHGNHVFMKE